MSDARLLPCPSCERHVRASEEACPFCAAALPERPAPAPLPRTPAVRLSRAAMFALGATAAAVAACSSSGPVYGGPADSGGAPGDSGRQDAPVPQPIYGGPPVDSGGDGPFLADAAYGGPLKDAASDADGGDAEGGPAPAYGAPP